MINKIEKNRADEMELWLALSFTWKSLLIIFLMVFLLYFFVPGSPPLYRYRYGSSRQVFYQKYVCICIYMKLNRKRTQFSPLRKIKYQWSYKPVQSKKFGPVRNSGTSFKWDTYKSIMRTDQWVSKWDRG